MGFWGQKLTSGRSQYNGGSVKGANVMRHPVGLAVRAENDGVFLMARPYRVGMVD